MPTTLIQQVKIEVGDLDPALPILSDDEYEYFLTKNNLSVRRASLDAAKTILFKLSMRTRERVDIFDIYGHQAAQNYIEALKLFLRNPDLNTVLQSVSLYAGGISKSDMIANNENPDNNLPGSSLEVRLPPKDLFSV